VNPDPGTFQAFYDSTLQHPILLWGAAAAAILLCSVRRDLAPSTRRFCIGLGILSLLDAWLTTSEIFGLGSLSGWSASAIPLFFVLAGDFRYFAFAWCAQPDGRMKFDGRSLLLALGTTLIVPVSTQGILTLLPDRLDTPRVMFFIYEVLFVLLTLALLRLLPAARTNAWVRGVSLFVVLYYSLWASADLVILATGSDLGFLMRVVPNILYYGGLIAVMGWSAPGRVTRAGT
jgi:hypothetical protein